MTIGFGATKFGFFVFIAVFFTTYAHPDKLHNSERDEYEDVPDHPFPGKIEIMPIVQRDTKHKGVSETVREIIRELPNDEQYERIGKMLNNSYDTMNREVAEGKSAIRQKMVRAEERTSSAMEKVAVVLVLLGEAVFYLL